MVGQLRTGALQGQGRGALLALAEGFETAQAFTILHGTPCWACLCARRLYQISIPGNVTELVLAADDEGERAARRAATALARPGLKITSAFPAGRGDDCADVLDRRARSVPINDAETILDRVLAA